jgi:hypothetical protein
MLISWPLLPFMLTSISSRMTVEVHLPGALWWYTSVVSRVTQRIRNASSRYQIELRQRVSLKRFSKGINCLGLYPSHFRRSFSAGILNECLSCYRDLMTQRDVTFSALTGTSEETHRDSFYISLLQNRHLLPRAEFSVTKVISIGSLLARQYLITSVFSQAIKRAASIF